MPTLASPRGPCTLRQSHGARRTGTPHRGRSKRALVCLVVLMRDECASARAAARPAVVLTVLALTARSDWYNYPIGLRGDVPEQVFLGLQSEFETKLPFAMVGPTPRMHQRPRSCDCFQAVRTFARKQNPTQPNPTRNRLA